MSLKNWISHQLEVHRGLVVVLFCLPASFIFDLVLKGWARLSNLFLPQQSHEERVKEIQDKVGAWWNGPRDRKLCTARPNWLSLSTTFPDKSRLHQIPIRLNRILALDEERLILKTEPMVSVHEACQFLIPRGYALAVTLEIGDATLGGLALAVGMTTHSHKAPPVGLYQEAVEAYEVVLGDGRVVEARLDNEHKDLFRCLPWSHGTLGFLVSLQLRLIRVKPYVRLRYIPVCSNIRRFARIGIETMCEDCPMRSVSAMERYFEVTGQSNYCNMMRKLSGAESEKDTTPDFLEATVFSPNAAVVMVGNFADANTPEDQKQINHVARWYKPWFYKHVESFLSSEGEELVPLQDYLLRHNRAIFWVVEAMIPFGNRALFRLLLGWLLPPKPAFLKLTSTKTIREMTFTKQIFQDIVLPMTVLEKSINLATELFDTFPLLIYPCRIYDHGPESGQLRFSAFLCRHYCSIWPPRKDQMTAGSKYGMFYDLGVYGVPGPVKRKEPYNAATTLHRMEEFIRASGGYSFLYADYTLNREEFEEMFDLSLYRRVRKRFLLFANAISNCDCKQDFSPMFAKFE